MICDADVIEMFSGKNALLDALLVAVIVMRNDLGDADVELRFKGRKDSDFTEISIQFTEVAEFEFSYEREDTFLDIWDLKFLILEDGSFYISLDPDPSTLLSAGAAKVEASDTDHFFIRARHIKAAVTKAR
jgi:hypothetical protein